MCLDYWECTERKMNRGKKLTYKEYLRQVFPNILAHITTLLVRVIELGIVGKLLDPIYIAAYGVAITIFNSIDFMLMFWRISTVNESISAYHKKDEKAQAEVLTQHVIVMFIVGCLFILMKDCIWGVIKNFYKLDRIVEKEAYTYYKILIQTMPIRLTNYMIMGWFIGRNKGKENIFLESIFNGLHIVLCFILVFGFDKGLPGMALSYAFSEIIILIVHIIVLYKKEKSLLKYMKEKSIWYPKNIWFKIRTNRDTIIRMGYSTVISNLMIATSSCLGMNILVANIIMMQIKDTVSYFYEGIASTVRSYAILSVQSNDMSLLKTVHRMTLETIMYISVAIVIVYQMSRIFIVGGITNLSEIKHTVWTYDGWLSIYPILAGWGLGAYGLYVGLTQVKMINYILKIAFVVFLGSYTVLVPRIGNHGLWAAFISFYLIRSIGLLIYESHLYED